MQEHLVIEVKRTPAKNVNIFVMVHGVFSDLDKAKNALKKLGTAELTNQVWKETSVEGKSIDDPNGPNILIFIQSLSTSDKIIY